MAIPTKIEIAQSAKLKPINEIAAMLGLDKLPICMAKTPLSLTDNENIAGMPAPGYKLPIVNLKPSTGVGFVVAYCGDINTIPALPTRPAAEDMDIDEKGVIKGLG